MADGLANSLFEIYLSKTLATEFGSRAVVDGTNKTGRKSAAHSAIQILPLYFKRLLPEISEQNIYSCEPKKSRPD